MKKKETQYAVLGLGVFGSSVAKTLGKAGCEVIAMDRDMTCVQRVADVVTQAVCGDVTDMNLLRSIGIQDCDVVIVAVGSHLEESLLCTLHVKEMGIPNVVAKAKNKSHRDILLKIGADRVIRPEKELGVITAKRLMNRNIVEILEIDEQYSILEVKVPTTWQNKTLQELDVRNRYGVNVLGIRYRNGELDIAPSPSYQLLKEDHLLMITHSSIDKLSFLNS